MIVWFIYEKMKHDSSVEVIAMGWCACLPETISGTCSIGLHYAGDIKQGAASCGLMWLGTSVYLSFFIFHLSVWSCLYVCQSLSNDTQPSGMQNNDTENIFLIWFFLSSFLTSVLSYLITTRKEWIIPITLKIIQFLLFSSPALNHFQDVLFYYYMWWDLMDWYDESSVNHTIEGPFLQWHLKTQQIKETISVVVNEIKEK